MSNIKTVTNFHPTNGYRLPSIYETQGQGWVKTTKSKELAKIGTIIKKNGTSHAIVEIREFFHDSTSLAIRRIFGTFLCIISLGIASAFKGIRNYFGKSTIMYFSAQTESSKTKSINPLMKADIERLIKENKENSLKPRDRATRKTPANNFRTQNLIKKPKTEEEIIPLKKDAPVLVPKLDEKNSVLSLKDAQTILKAQAILDAQEAKDAQVILKAQALLDASKI